MIRSFKDSDTEKVWNRELVRALDPNCNRPRRRSSASSTRPPNWNSLRVPPGNRLEKLFGDRAGPHSIRINNQYRICFVWTDNGADDVEITDYH